MNNDDDKDGFLTLENFVNFYHIAAKTRPNVVWNNLSAHHYRNDLKKWVDFDEEKIDIKLLPRYILCTNQQNFHLIFSLLGNYFISFNILNLS